jgi:hypothetical protein
MGSYRSRIWRAEVAPSMLYVSFDPFKRQQTGSQTIIHRHNYLAAVILSPLK